MFNSVTYRSTSNCLILAQHVSIYVCFRLTDDGNPCLTRGMLPAWELSIHWCYPVCSHRSPSPQVVSQCPSVQPSQRTSAEWLHLVANMHLAELYLPRGFHEFAGCYLPTAAVQGNFNRNILAKTIRYCHCNNAEIKSIISKNDNYWINSPNLIGIWLNKIK